MWLAPLADGLAVQKESANPAAFVAVLSVESQRGNDDRRLV
jgi:hypothetical protein